MRYRSGGPDRRQRQRDEPGDPPRPYLITAILGSYREMPGLRLRLEQAARLFGIRLRTCEVVLNDLVRDGRLRCAPDGQYSL